MYIVRIWSRHPTQEQRHRSNRSRGRVYRRKCFDSTCLNDSDRLPFDFKRSQFPARLAFAMTISQTHGHCVVVCLFCRVFVVLTLEVHASRVNFSVNCMSPVWENHQLCLFTTKRQTKKRKKSRIITYCNKGNGCVILKKSKRGIFSLFRLFAWTSISFVVYPEKSTGAVNKPGTSVFRGPQDK